MLTEFRIGIVQLNPIVGDVAGNCDRIAREYASIADADPDLVVTPELSVLGYPPRDLLHRTDLHDASRDALVDLAAQTRHGPPLVVGTATASGDGPASPLYNSAVVLRDGQREATYSKRLLPTYDVFDERRYFEPGTGPVVVDIDGVSVGLTICEDAWHDVAVTGRRRYNTNPLAETADSGADVLVTLSASPFSLDKPARREQRFLDHADGTDCPVVFANQVGGNDELVFDGHSLVAHDGQIVERLAGFTAETRVVSVGTSVQSVVGYSQPRREQARAALCLGIRDYFDKTGFEEAVIGLSGGIDSSVTGALATAALGADNVYGVSLPSSVTSQQSIDDARTLATNLAIEFDIIPIEDSIRALRSQLEAHATAPTGVTVENLQARVRGDLLMAIANERDALVLTPDNKSEAAVGYCTLYGDTVGALAPLGDCYKTLVYELASSFNADPPTDAAASTPIPTSVVDRPPTAELRDGQADADDLPAYDELDPALADYIEGAETRAGLVEQYDETVVEEIVGRVTRAEFKRRQTPPPLRITQKALSRGWCYPIAAEYDHAGNDG